MVNVPFEPFGGWVLVEPITRRETDGGIALPENVETHGEPPRAKVLKVGPGEETETGHRREMQVEPGDVIYMHFPHYGAPIALSFQGEQFALVQAKFICGRLLGQ